jgi:membrane protein DedA with SNARE-associated domain
LELLAPLLQFVLHPDQALAVLMREYGTWIYAILFVVLFCETGLVVTPFLPGDSLLFIAGALWASAGLDITALMAVMVSGALAGDNCNYWIGRVAYPRFLLFSIGGALLWVGLLVPFGYWFGNVGWVRANFGLVTIAIIAASLMPLAIEFAKHLRRPSKGA